MSDSYTEPASVAQDIIRSLFSTLDRPAYWLLGLVYELFFNVASADLFSNDTIMKFYGRVQVILGVFMMFQLAMTILKGIVNPDNFVSKDKGMGNIVTRIATSLVLITVLMPISIPSPKNEYEIQINNNGLLFGTLYSLQHRILANNTLGRLVLGSSGENNFVATNSGQDTELKKSARIFTSTILKGFYRINLVPENQRDTTYLREGKDPATYNANRVCKDIDDQVLAAYTRIDADPGEIISLVNATCDSNAQAGFLNSAWTGIQKLTGTTKYVFAYMPVISTIVAVVFVFILLSFTIDVAVRAVKLAVLRLIAPIPIIAYMDPKGGKDSAFNSWVKTLSSTYLDLFIRLAVVYFVIFLIQDMIINGVVIDVGTGVIGVLSHIIIWVGLFIFAKQAPKFIRQVLGMKDEGGKLFGGFGEIAAVGAAGLGVIGSARAGWRAANEENEALHPGSSFNGIRNVGSALASAIGGGYVGVKALMGKDGNAKSVMAAQNQRNAARAAHSTFTGRIADSAYSMFNGRSLAALDQSVLDANQSAAKSIKAFKATSVEEAMKKGSFGTVSAAKDRFGRLAGIQFNYRQLEAAMATKDTSGNFDYTDASGVVRHLNAAWFDAGVMADIEDSQTSNYLASEWNGSGFNNGKINTDWRNAKYDMGQAEISFAGNYLGQTDYSEIGKKIGEANSNVADMSTDMRHIMHRANNQNKK